MPVAVHDSGIGGFSVVRALRVHLPDVPILYLADQGQMPYGDKPLAEVHALTEDAARMAQAAGARLLVLACNTASAAALHPLRATFPDFPFVGMEPAVKPAAEQSTTGRVGVLATEATFQGELFARVVERFARGVRVYPVACPGLASRIEQGADEAAIRPFLEGWLHPLRAVGIDRLVLACTHYPLILPLIREVIGEGVEIVDPSDAVARQAARIWQTRPPVEEPEADLFLTTASSTTCLTAAMARYLPAPPRPFRIRRVGCFAAEGFAGGGWDPIPSRPE